MIRSYEQPDGDTVGLAGLPRGLSEPPRLEAGHGNRQLEACDYPVAETSRGGHVEMACDTLGCSEVWHRAGSHG